MNSAHLHLLINHFPIIGLFFGIIILIYGIFKRNHLVLNIAYMILIFSMVTGKLSMITGDKAEDFIEKMNNFSNNLIEIHEEKAEIFMKIMYILGVTSIIGLIANNKKHSKTHLIAILILITGTIGIILSQPVGTSGGKIHHNEINENLSNTSKSKPKIMR
ncbi:hypothetical protein [Flavobacterium oreochromis]|uniref:DUF2231 domain-containing protein n=2 Tax=Flavobacterium TaxID=237 RepID=A0A246GDJ3_9FLAO|nr:hypothetical protein [Flavobacterium oreochromis]OWP74872.1 hypothetical protein BWG23_12740 [Flavobacterium oreochromis]OWP79350.1 hypothetical protein BWK62_02285 [Flavobacterium oreochromis]POR20735.1 hypothetical protein BWK58_13625 [Flavobacterium columnare]QYS86437.1 hypothetical protein JJC03_16310 [Flavobacterium oreochromis]